MKDGLFLGERYENGIRYKLSKDFQTGKTIHWELMATKIRGYEAAIIRQEAKKRSEVGTKNPQKTSILPIQPLITHQGETWIGWEERSGINIHHPNYQPPELGQLIRELGSLIDTFIHYHQKGLLIGRPEWRRIYHDETGFFLPDPWSRPYLTTPEIELPTGFSACRAPESFYGNNPTQSCDLFYLGLLLYYLLCGQLPYSLEDGWPTSSLLKGEIIPLSIYRPEINPRLAILIEKLLSPKKYERPSLAYVKAIWDEVCDQEAFLAESTEKKSNLRYIQKYKYLNFWNQRVLKYGKKLLSIRMIWVFIIIACLYFAVQYLWNSTFQPPSASEAVEEFYQTAANPLGIISSSNQESLKISDIIEARQKRMKMIAELLGKPVVEVKRVKVSPKSENSAIVEAELVWWDWQGKIWQPSSTTEVLYLRKAKNKWWVVKRIQRKQL